MASATPPRLALLGWALLAAMGAINILNHDVVTGVGLVISGGSLAAIEVVGDKVRWLGGALRLLGATGGVLALVGIGIEHF